MHKTKIAFFSPFAEIWPHSLPESYLAKGLDRNKFDVFRISCDGTFSTHCTAMSGVGVKAQDSEEKKRKVCQQCIQILKLLANPMEAKSIRSLTISLKKMK